MTHVDGSMITRRARAERTETLIKRQDGCEQLHDSAIQKCPFILISYVSAFPFFSVPYEKVMIIVTHDASATPRHD